MWLSPGKIKHEYPETSLPGNATGIRQKNQQLQQQKNLQQHPPPQKNKSKTHQTLERKKCTVS